ncbi:MULTISPECIES: hypothetical protein [Pseudomonas chlororaphis group]|uniref:hypothetical protein n=1 Tax=Pseudomonas chlororaphis group TaxID=136842 RepID=UPI002096ECF2|nr:MULTISPECIES: hypothetical protein [Pseudomonas chlororaphis group]MCO7577812.1 hypothetical protein [Pseudomonas protegens]MCO7584187.1 hypothetical protein [Pseudomonas chlororaphis]MCO7601195.1 hypothetical protein [Pseudomonas chlororaphis]
MKKDKSRIGDYLEGPSLDELIDAAAAEAEADLKGKRGSARAQLIGHKSQLLRMLEKKLPLRKQVELLSMAKPPVIVTAVSLRNFLISEFPEEWATYLAVTGRGRKENRSYKSNVPDTEQLTAAPTPAEQSEVDRHLSQGKTGTREKTTPPAQQTKTSFLEEAAAPRQFFKKKE